MFKLSNANKIGIIKILSKSGEKKYYIEDMVKEDVIFSTTGVTDGDILKGIKDSGDFFESETLVLHHSSKTNNIIKSRIKK